MKNANNTFTRTQSILLAKVADMSADTKAAVDNGNITLQDAYYFKRYEITGAASILEVLKNDDAIKDGFCNISKQKIDQGDNLLLSRLSVRVAASTDSGATAGTVKYSKVQDSTDAAVINAELELYVKQMKVFSAPLSEFTQEQKDVHSMACNINLSAPKLITDADQIQVRLKFPDGASVSTASSTKTFVEVALCGDSLRIL